VSVPQLIAASVAMAFGALVQGAVGFGASLVAAPLLALVDPEFVPGPISVATFVLNIIIIRTARSAAPDREIRWAIMGVVPGTLVAGIMLSLLSTRGLSIAFAILVFVGVGLTASGVSVRKAPSTLFGAGVASGFMGTVSSIGGPPIALLYQRASGATLRATLPRYFLVSGVIALAALAIVGKLGRNELFDAAALLPGVVVGLTGSRWLARHVDRRSARPWVLGLSALAAVSALVRELL
jgi:uncharacterized membrane protein YfcA